MDTVGIGLFEARLPLGTVNGGGRGWLALSFTVGGTVNGAVTMDNEAS